MYLLDRRRGANLGTKNQFTFISPRNGEYQHSKHIFSTWMYDFYCILYKVQQYKNIYELADLHRLFFF